MKLPENPMTEPYPQPAQFDPYQAAIEGWTPHDVADWPNTVSVAAVAAAGWTTVDTPSGDHSEGYADADGERQLVEIDTNYKPSRTSEHPVRLTRTQALELVVHLLAATEDTFHDTRVGRLRATEAAQLLTLLGEVDYVLHDFRGHALHDLLRDTGFDALS